MRRILVKRTQVFALYTYGMNFPKKLIDIFMCHVIYIPRCHMTTLSTANDEYEFARILNLHNERQPYTFKSIKNMRKISNAKVQRRNPV